MAYITWRVNKAIFAEFNHLWALIKEERDSGNEWSDEYYVLLDQIKSLPGYPLNYSERHDTIIVTEVASPTSLIHREH